MKILELQLTAFGPFGGQTLDLSAGNPGLHVVFGPNEAGKSSALRGLHALLYGIPGQTNDAFLHPYDAMRIGGRLRHSRGTEIAFARRKGNKNTLLAPDGTRLDDHALDRFLGGESAEKFQAFWGIDHARLVQGGREILEGQGDLGESLFAAGSGASNLRKLRSTLEVEAAELYAPRGQRRAVNQGLDKLRELRAAQREATVSVDEWTRCQHALRDATEAVTNLSTQAQELARERSRLERVKRILPLLAERKGLHERLALVADAVLLSEDFPQRRHQAETALRTARQALERREEELREQKAIVDLLGPTPPLVAESDAVNQLHIDLGRHRKALLDRPKLAGQRSEQRALAKRLLAEARPDLEIDAAMTLRVFVGRRDRIRKLGTERARLDERLASAARDGDKASEQEEVLKREASELPSARDPEPLAEVIVEAQRGGDAEGEREKAVQLVKRLTAQLDAGIERLGLPAPAADGLDDLRVPSAAAIARFESRNKELDDEVRTTKSERQRLDKEIRQLSVKIETLHTKRAVPTEADLSAARTRRDAAFELLREHWEKSLDVTEKARELLGQGKLIELYPRTVAEADEVADRLRADAEHVAMLAHHLEDRDRLGTEVEDAEASARRQKEQAAEIGSQWRTLWQPVLNTPPSIDDARAWRTDFEALLERSQALVQAREELLRLDAWIEKQVEGLSAAVTALEPDARLPARLAAAVAAGEKLRQRIEKEQRARSEHGRRTSETRQAILDAEKAKRAAQAEIDEWQRKWTEATRGLLPGDAAPADDVLAAVDTVEKALRALDEAAGYDARIAGIDRDAEQFRVSARALALRLNETLGPEAEDHWVEDVHNRLTASLQLEERRRQALSLLTRLRAELNRDGEAVKKADLALVTLREEASCGYDIDFARDEQRRIELRTCRKEIERIERELIRGGDGASIAELESEAVGADRDTMDIRLGEIGTLLVEVEKQLTAARDARASAQAELGMLQGPSVASDKAEEIQATLAKLREDVVTYARLRVASALLARRIDDYRRRNQAPLLLRAGAHFREMTLGSFDGLEADVDEDRPILAGIRPDGKRVPAHGMSEGTRDQLCLALRLAAVEASCATGEPLPFIVDDVLVQFDDKRTAAGLRVLANVARCTQIVLFTHHGHVRASAESLAECVGVIVHEL